MLLKDLINKSVYGNIGYVASQDDLDLLERYILYNLPVLKEYKQIITATNYKKYPEFTSENTQLWKKYFPDCIIIDLETNRGPNFGYCDLDDALFDYCKENNIEWLCKSANDVVFQEEILNKEVEEADFYYLNGIGYGGMVKYNFDFNRIVNEDFYPQTNFYFINVFKTDYLNDKDHVIEIYNKVQNIPEYNGKAWEYGFRSCETLLRECVERNNLLKYHLVSQKNYHILLEIIRDNNIHDSSHKNIMIEGICHYPYINQQIIEIENMEQTKSIGISLGWNCGPAGYGTANGLREVKANGYQTCPFDEMVSNLPGVIECIKDDFKYFMDDRYLEIKEVPFNVGGTVKGEKLVYNTKYNFFFNHESPGHGGLYISQGWTGGINHYIDNNYALLKERYNRRVEAFRKYIQEGQNDSEIVFIVFRYNKDVEALKTTLNETYPNLKYRIIVENPPETVESVYMHHVLMGMDENNIKIEVQQ